jgi:hypothetical protein
MKRAIDMLRKSIHFFVVLAAVAALLAACQSQGTTSSIGSVAAGGSIDRRPPAADFSFVSQKPVNLVKPAGNGDPFAVDLRHHDMSKIDLSGAGDILIDYASWDTATKWPAALPQGFDPARFLELGKDPGLEVRELHRQGITGKVVRVAFIDQTLLVDHEEYRSRIESYHEIGKVPHEAQMHSAAIMSILAGTTIGVAPEVSVTFYVVDHLAGNGQFKWPNHARAINEILDANARLPFEQRIRVIGISLGYSREQEGYAEMKAAVARAKQEGVLVLTTSVEEDYTFRFHGLGRDPLADPNDVNVYGPGAWWAEQFCARPEFFADRILAPMEFRTTADPTGVSHYTYYRQGGLSWVVPYLEGVYALGLQVRPDLTPEEFYRAALSSGSQTTVTRSGKNYELGPIINPAALIAKLKAR